MNNINDINKIVEDINIYIDNLLIEHIDEGTTPNKEYDDIVSKDKGELTIDDRSEQLGKDLINGDVTWESIFTPDEIKNFEDWERKGSEGVGYVIVGGKYAKKVLAAPVVGAYKVYQLTTGKTKIKNPFKRKVNPDICNCIAFAKKYTPVMADCTNVKECHKTFKKALNNEIATLSEHEGKIADDYARDCINNYAKIIFNFTERDDPSIISGCRTFKVMLDDAATVANDLGSLLGKYFRIKNQIDPNRNKKTNSVAEKLVLYEEITISFDPDPTTPSNIPATPDCNSFVKSLTNSEKFKVMSASNKNVGKTVELKIGGKYCLMTFNNADRGIENGGSIKWIDVGTKEIMCAITSWKGKITNLKS